MERCEPRGERRRGPLPELSLDVLSHSLEGRQQRWLTRGPGAHGAQCARTARTAQGDGSAHSADGWFPIIFRHLVDTDWTGPYLWPSCLVVCMGGRAGVRACEVI